MSLERTNGHFETTCWSLIQEIAAGDEERSRKAEEELARRYWPPVYAYLRRSGRSGEAAAELTQAFFADVVFGRKLFQRADRECGRLRTLILTSLTRYVIDNHRRAIVRGGTRIVPMEAMRAEDHRLAALDPTDAFDRRWAIAQLEEAMRRCERHFRDSGRARHWEAFEARVLRPSVSGGVAPPLADLAPRLGFARAADAAAAVQVVRKRALALLRDVVAESVRDLHDAHLEWAETMQLLGR